MSEATTEFCLTHGRAHPDDEGTPDGKSCRIEEWPMVAGIILDSVEVEDEPEPFHILERGDLAYLDSFSGLIPIKVESVRVDDTTIKVTKTMGAYGRGEVLHLQNPRISVVHRKQVSTKRGIHRVNGRVRFMTDAGNLLP